MSVLPAQAFKEAIAGRPSLKSRNIAREEQVLMVDFASDSQVRVRWNTAVYVDYLTFHRIAGDWLITSKGFHIESTDAPSKMNA